MGNQSTRKARHRIKNMAAYPRMAISVSKKSRLPRKREANIGFFCSFIANVFLRFPAALLLLILILLYSSSTTIITGHIVHVCVSSRKLNDLYCISAGSQPGFEVPGGTLSKFDESIPRINRNFSSFTDGDKKADSKEAVDVVLESPISAVNNSVTKPHDQELANKDVEVPIPLVDNGSNSSSGDEKGSLETVADELESPISSVNGSMDKPKDEESAHVLGKVLVPVPLITSDSTGGDKADNLKETVDTIQGRTVEAAISIMKRPNNEELANAYQEVEEQLRVHWSWRSDKNHKSCEGTGIYVYELPSKFNKDLANQCTDMIPWMNMCKYFSNEGLGEPIEKLGKGWYETHQYSLEPIFHSRVLKHPCRVHNENEAKLFYVPYYGGLDILRWHFKNVSDDVKDSLALELIRWLETQKPWFQKQGKDHVFVLGKISWDFRRNSTSSWGTNLLELAEMQNPIKLLIERQPWQINDIGIPHPTSFHPHTDDDIVSWQLKAIRSNRGSLVSFAGGARPKDPESIRSILISQCASAINGQCKLLNCSLSGCEKPESFVELFLESEFCLQPAGDSATRKSVFDSLLSGCIPVLFNPFTAYYQYPWHLPEDHEKYSVFIDEDELKNKNVNVIERLMNIPLRERENMRKYIVYELLPGLVYADSSSQLQNFQDAFAISMNNLLSRISKFNEL